MMKQSGDSNADRATIDAIFRRLNRPVWIVTAAHAGRRGGLAATFVSPASIDAATPQLVAAIAVNHFTRELIDGAGAFAAHLLRSDQTELCLNFAIGSGRDRDKFEDVGHSVGDAGAPLLGDCLARLDCRVFARFPAGERVYYWADVVSGHWPGGESQREALLCEQDLMAAADDEQKKALQASRQADMEAQAPLQAQWRKSLKL